MNCPTCDAQASCINSRRRPEYRVWRSYKCVKGHRWSSLETVIAKRGMSAKSGAPKGWRPFNTVLQERESKKEKEEMRKRLLDAIDGREPQHGAKE